MRLGVNVVGSHAREVSGVAWDTRVLVSRRTLQSAKLTRSLMSL